MRPLRFSINLALDGCSDHNTITPDEELHRHHIGNLAAADALVFGRTIYTMMESAWRPVGETGGRPEWMAPWMLPFAQQIHGMKKYVVSSPLEQVDWNAELIRGDLACAVQELKQPGEGLFVSGVQLPMALAELGLIDEYEFVMHPVVAGHGPSLFAGLSRYLHLKPLGRTEFHSGAVALRYAPT